MTTRAWAASNFVRWAGSIALSIAFVCGIGEYLAWNRLKVVPCAPNSILEWKGMTKCVSETQSVLWHVLDYGLKAALILLLVSMLAFKGLEARKT